MKALDGLTEAPPDLGELLRAEDERRDSGDHDELGDPESEQAAAPEGAAPVLPPKKGGAGCPPSAGDEEQGAGEGEGGGFPQEPRRGCH